jgi:hypothetical protein
MPGVVREPGWIRALDRGEQRQDAPVQRRPRGWRQRVLHGPAQQLMPE